MPSSDADANSDVISSVIAYSSLSAIDSMTSYIHSGTIETGTLSFSYSVSEDISDYSVIDKINYLYEQGDITEEEKIIYYCDLASPSCEIEFELECGNVLYDEITAYADSTDVISDEVSAAITEAVSSTNPPSYTDYVLAQVGSYFFKIYYNPSEGMTASVANKVADEVKSICSYFVINNGFNEVIMYDTSTYYYLIYLVPDDYMSANGLTVYTTSSGRATGSSYICMKYSRAEVDVSKYGVTLAHEFMHAIMATYGTIALDEALWFNESFASMSGLVYYGESTDWHNSFVSDYLDHCYTSLYNTDYTYMSYGSLVYPLYIYEYLGGWDAIQTIYEGLEDASTVYEAISCLDAYGKIFLAASARNYDVGYYYSDYNPNWGSVPTLKITVPSSTESLSTTLSVNPMACRYRTFSSSTSRGTVYFSIQNVTGNSGIAVDKIRIDTLDIPHITTISTSFSKVTVSQASFGATYPTVVFDIFNTNTSGSSNSCKISFST